MRRSLPLRITLVNPPRGVSFCLQEGRHDLVAPTSESTQHMSFDFAVNVANEGPVEPPNFLGSFVQGPRGGRFVYANSGTYAGESESCWSRRAKISLSAITWDLIEKVLSNSNQVLEARIQGTGRDGGPVCASVPLLDAGWKVVKGK